MSRNANEASHALVRAGVTPVRAEPSVRAEQKSQEVLGAALEILERNAEWAQVRGEDDYEGWVSLGALVLCNGEQAAAWLSGADGRAALALSGSVVTEAGTAIAHLPWGARVSLATTAFRLPEGPFVRLPDGRSGRLRGGQLVPEEELAARYPASGSAVVDTGREWLAVPYLWGGRTRWGVDCSGLVQAVYRLHGVRVPRDSHQQALVGDPVTYGDAYEEVAPGDLLFFKHPESKRVVHVVISLGGPEILHAAQANGLVTEDSLIGDSALERSLAGRLIGVKRVFGSEPA